MERIFHHYKFLHKFKKKKFNIFLSLQKSLILSKNILHQRKKIFEERQDRFKIIRDFLQVNCPRESPGQARRLKVNEEDSICDSLDSRVDGRLNFTHTTFGRTNRLLTLYSPSFSRMWERGSTPETLWSLSGRVVRRVARSWRIGNASWVSW